MWPDPQLQIHAVWDLCAFHPYCKKILLQWSGSVKILTMGTSRGMPTIPLFVCGCGNGWMCESKNQAVSFSLLLLKNAEKWKWEYTVALQTCKKLEVEGSRIKSDLSQSSYVVHWSITFSTFSMRQKPVHVCVCKQLVGQLWCPQSIFWKILLKYFTYKMPCESAQAYTYGKISLINTYDSCSTVCHSLSQGCCSGCTDEFTLQAVNALKGFIMDYSWTRRLSFPILVLLIFRLL